MTGKRIDHLILGALVVAGIGSAVVGEAQERQRHAPAVQQDLENAMKGEAFAYAKYMLYAQQARAHGHPDIAALFERTANTERMEHFRQHADLAGLMASSDADNLRSAMAGEQYETSRMYPEMAARARKAGDTQVAERFTEIGRDESKHHDQFAAALAKLEKGSETATRQRK